MRKKLGNAPPITHPTLAPSFLWCDLPHQVVPPPPACVLAPPSQIHRTRCRAPPTIGAASTTLALVSHAASIITLALALIHQPRWTSHLCHHRRRHEPRPPSAAARALWSRWVLRRMRAGHGTTMWLGFRAHQHSRRHRPLAHRHQGRPLRYVRARSLGSQPLMLASVSESDPGDQLWWGLRCWRI